MVFSRSKKNKPFQISNISVQPGENITVALECPQVHSCVPMYIPIHVLHGKKEGPVLLICATMHGDEVNGISIIQKLLSMNLLKSLAGTILAIPVMNVYGLMVSSRTLPDRRDLDGSFPGSETGSFSSRLAHTLNTQVIEKATHCIDLHTGEPLTQSLPQIHTNGNCHESIEMAKAFGSPVIMNTDSQHGMLWLSHKKNSIPSIIYEVGEAQKIHKMGVNLGVQGILSVMRSLEMLPPLKTPRKEHPYIISSVSKWIFSPSSGLCELAQELGAHVEVNKKLARISDPFGSQNVENIYSNTAGVIIASNISPIVNEGDPIVQIAEFSVQEAAKITKWDEQKEDLI